MTCRLSRFLLVLCLILGLSVPSAFAQTDNMIITNVIQNGGELVIYMNQYDSSGNVSTDVYDAGAYTFSAVNTSTRASSVSSLAQVGNMTTYYTILCDATLENNISGQVNAEIIKFAQTLNSERLRIIYYTNQILKQQGYVDSASGLERGTGSDATRVYQYGRHTATAPSMINALSFAIRNISQDNTFQASSVRHAIVVISDTDAEAVDAQVMNLIAQYHIPIFVVFVGSNSTNSQKFVQNSGGRLFNTTIGNISNELFSVRNAMSSGVVLRVKPPYEVFTQGTVNITVSLNTGRSTITSSTYAKTLTSAGVPTPSPTVAPTDKPTATPVPVTDTPAPTVPPKASATPVITEVPSPAPSDTPVVITVIITPEPTNTPKPATPEPPPTVPPTEAPTETPVVTEAPTEAPVSGGGFMDFINEKLGPDGIWIAGAGLLFLIAVVILLVIFLSSKKKNKKPVLEADLRSLSFNSGDEVEATTYSKAGGADGEATTYSKSPGAGRNDGSMGSSALDSNDDMNKTTSPFSRPAVEQIQQSMSMFGSGDSAQMDFGDKTVAISNFGDDDKTVRIQDNSGLKLKFTAETNGRTKEYTASIRQKITVGRGADCEVCIEDNSVSKHHIEISYESDGLYVRDLGSSNGTLLNGEKVTGSTPLRTNDVLVLGYSKVTVEVLP